MTAHIYTEADAPIEPLKGKRIAVIGYGSQGHAHALNMHDSGLDVMVGLYQGSKSWAAAEQAGLEVAEVADAAKQADVVVMLVPDEKQRRIFEDNVLPQVKPGTSLVWAHGFNIHFKQIVPPEGVDVWMVAPKAPGQRMRELLKEIQDGTFAHRWLDENELGRPNFNRYREEAANEPMEKVGRDLRSLMNKQGLTTTTG